MVKITSMRGSECAIAVKTKDGRAERVTVVVYRKTKMVVAKEREIEKGQ